MFFSEVPFILSSYKLHIIRKTHRYVLTHPNYSGKVGTDKTTFSVRLCLYGRAPPPKEAYPQLDAKTLPFFSANNTPLQVFEICNMIQLCLPYFECFTTNISYTFLRA